MGIEERKQREFLRREREVLDAALSLLSHDDWLSITVEQIAERAEVGKGTIYKHFKSKNEIYAHLMLDFHRILLRRLQTVRRGVDAEGLVKPVIRAMWATYLAHPEYHRLLEHTLRASFLNSLSEALRDEWENLNARIMQEYMRSLELGVKAGLFPNRPLLELLEGPSAILSGAVMALWNGWLEMQGKDSEAYIETICDFVVAGLTQNGSRTYSTQKEPDRK